jgi:hypothetical protein
MSAAIASVQDYQTIVKRTEPMRTNTMPLTHYQKSELAERRRRAGIEVMNRGEVVARYGAGTTLQQVVDELVKDYCDETYAGLDLAVWSNGYLAAVIREGLDGQPELTSFDFEWTGLRAALR